jgi:Skp family chaperone for outer membrane proteins
MSTLLRILALAGLIAGTVLPAAAQTARPAAAAPTPAAPRGPTPPPSIGVVDMALIQEQASVMKSIRDQMQKEEQGIRGDLTKRENDLRAADQDLQQQRSLLSADAYAEKRRNFEAQVGESQRYMAARKKQLDTAFNDGMRQVDQALNAVLREIAQERGLNLIMPRGALMLLADTNLDITDDVKRRLDNRLKSVAIKLPPLQK